MGVPLIAGLAASAIGTGMQMAASKQEQRRMNQQAQEELSRQKGYRGQADVEFQKSLGKSGVVEARKEIGTGTQNLMDAYKSVQQIPVTLPGTPTSPSARSVEDVGTGMMNMRSDVARAKLGGYSEFDIQQMIKNVRAQQNLGLIGTSARMSAGVSPYEIQAAGRSAEGLRGAGSLISTLGSLASVYGGMQAGAAAGKTATAAAGASALGSAGDAYFKRFYGGYPQYPVYPTPTYYTYPTPTTSL
jgi:hypothetical protein